MLQDLFVQLNFGGVQAAVQLVYIVVRLPLLQDQLSLRGEHILDVAQVLTRVEPVHFV